MPPRSHADLNALERLGNTQHSCVSLAQLAQLGMGSSTIARRTRPEDGRWQRLLPGVVLLHTGTPTPRERVAAAMLYADGAVITGAESLRRQGFLRIPPTNAVQVLVPAGRHRASTRYVTVERTHRMPEPIWCQGVPCTTVARALVDHCRQLRDLSDIRSLVAEGIQRKLCSQEDLIGELHAAQRRGTARLRLVAKEIIAGIRSAMEADLRTFILKSNIPERDWNMDLLDETGTFIGAPDGWWARAATALEMDSREWHLDPEGWERTQKRRARFARFGISTIPVTPKRLYRESDELIADIMGSLNAGYGRPALGIVAVRRSQAA